MNKNIIGLVSILIILVGENYFTKVTHQLLIPLFFTILFFYLLFESTKKEEKNGDRPKTINWKIIQRIISEFKKFIQETALLIIERDVKRWGNRNSKEKENNKIRYKQRW